jgi:predicted negative regulator of RcsB-dependent stress response
VPFTVTVPNVEAVWRGKVDKAIADNPTNEVIPLQVAGAYANDDKWDEALKWVDQSIKVKETFRNLSARANLLWQAGKKQEALAAADVAIAKGKADKVDTANFEKRVATWKAGS